MARTLFTFYEVQLLELQAKRTEVYGLIDLLKVEIQELDSQITKMQKRVNQEKRPE